MSPIAHVLLIANILLKFDMLRIPNVLPNRVPLAGACARTSICVWCTSMCIGIRVICAQNLKTYNRPCRHVNGRM